MPLLKDIITHTKAELVNYEIVPSYYSSFDDKYKGFKKKDITFIASRPCNGKTWFLCNLAVNMAIHQKKVIFYTQSIRNIAQRIESLIVNIPQIYIEEMQIFNQREFRSKCQEIIPDIVMIDVHLLGNIINKKILQRIKQIAIILNFAVIITGTLNRSIDFRPNKYPQIKDLLGINEQKGVLEIADTIFMFYNPQHYFPDFVLQMPPSLEIIPIRAYSQSSVRLEWENRGKLIEYKPKIMSMN